MKSPSSTLSVVLFILTQGLGGSAGEFKIRDGDRVAFLGDSITEQRLYTTYIEAYTLTRFPTWNLSFRNVGWGGDTSWLRQRAHPDESKLFAADETTQQKMVEESVGKGLGRDVLPLKPTFVTVKFGMNDHSRQPFREDIFRAYVRSQTQIAKVLNEHGARVAFLTPQPIEEKRPDPDKDPRNISLRRFSDGLKDVAAKTGSVFVEQFDPFMTILLRERAGNPDHLIGGGDAVHPGPVGQTIMAWAVLKGLGGDSLVSRVDIDAMGQKLTTAEKCKISQLKFGPGAGFTFERLDEALPMPVDARAETALKLAPVLEDLNRYELRVTGLPAGSYELRVDGEVAGKATAEELGRGWNLANVPGPITLQAQQILKLIFEKNDLFFRRWREIQLFGFPGWAQGAEAENIRSKAIAKIGEQIREKEMAIEKLRKPQSRKFELKPSSQ
jgi:lysophospholipase L1-like esterase